MTASSMGCTPLFLNALPHSTGYSSLATVSLRMPALISSMLSSSPPRYFSSSASSDSATVSSSSLRYSAALSARSAGISTVS
ncbi:Uncharacterised protein [Mycobacteroides abscessus subsp. abscessus]|nr:Uncharacterised protein [Mycobacteroides abscessus]SHV89465.1 Uncharacterised protein [Mycobacteroides abscessus subsp. abscessus]SKS77971.1 Uncharacterised protein [Mycobacteroides abscessus subsp. abscessus]